MPHQIIEYSGNLDERMSVDGLVGALHAAAADLEALPLAGLRTRSHRVDHFAVADQHPDNAFIAVYLRIGKGRDEATRVALGRALADALVAHVRQALGDAPIALSYEVQEIDPATRWNENNLREHMAARGAPFKG